MKKWEDIFTKIIFEFTKNRNIAVARADQEYHKAGDYRSFGMSTPTVNSILRQFRSTIKGLTKRETFLLVRKLYQEKENECKLFANSVLAQKIEEMTKADVKRIGAVVPLLGSWSAVDDFCIDVAQKMLFRFPTETLAELRRWNRSKDIWRQRASVVTLTRKVGASGIYTEELLQFSTQLAFSDHDLVRKGVGWALKDGIVGNPQSVLKFVEKLKVSGAPSVVTSYALRNIRKYRQPKANREQ